MERRPPRSTLFPYTPLFRSTRLHEPPMEIGELPPVDAVLISHDHYDHLDLPTVRALVETQTAPFVVPLGIGEHLRSEEHTSELQSRQYLVCRLLLEKTNNQI